MSFKDEVREKLLMMQDGMVLYLNSHSDVVQTRVVATELGKKITARKVNDCQWAVTLKTGRGMALLFAESDTSHGVYANKVKHWANKMTPVGTSGMPKEGLSWYAQGHEDIPEDWTVYVEDFDMVFKPRFVKDPCELLNDKLIRAGLPPTRFMLDENFNKLEQDEAENRFNKIRNRNTNESK